MIDLEVYNFQSVEQAKVCIEGFTVVLGPSDIGKSAFVRAVKCALTNASGTGFVRHGNQCHRLVKGTKKCKCAAKVVLGMPERTITWEKGDSVNCYTVVDKATGKTEVYENLDRGTPEFLSGFQRVKVGTKQDLVQVPKQFEPIFLLNESGGVVADVLSDLASLGRLNDAADLVSKDKKDASAKKRIREEDLVKLREESERYVGLDEVDTAYLKTELGRVDKTTTSLDQVTRYQSRQEGLDNAHQRLSEVVDTPVPAPTDIAKNYRLYHTVDQSIRKYSQINSDLTSLETKTSSTLPDTGSLESLGNQLTKVLRFQKRYVDIIRVGTGLNAIEKLSFPSDQSVNNTLSQLVKIDKLTKSHRILDAWKARSEALEKTVVPSPDGLDLKNLNQVNLYSQRLSQQEEGVRKTQVLLDQASSEYETVLAELKSLGVCPVCSQSIGEGHNLHTELL